jgi:hypothetical protein
MKGLHGTTHGRIPYAFGQAISETAMADSVGYANASPSMAGSSPALATRRSRPPLSHAKPVMPSGHGVSAWTLRRDVPHRKRRNMRFFGWPIPNRRHRRESGIRASTTPGPSPLCCIWSSPVTMSYSMHQVPAQPDHEKSRMTTPQWAETGSILGQPASHEI